MVVTQDQPLANVFRQLSGGAFPAVVESYERGKNYLFPWGSGRTGLFFVERGCKAVAGL